MTEIHYVEGPPLLKTIAIPIRTYDGADAVDVEAHVVGEVAWHRYIAYGHPSSDDGAWSCTHVPSGMAIAQFIGAHSAELLARAMAPMDISPAAVSPDVLAVRAAVLALPDLASPPDIMRLRAKIAELEADIRDMDYRIADLEEERDEAEEEARELRAALKEAAPC
jgi:outer membrane murein-binding lipoprotein Lpp